MLISAIPDKLDIAWGALYGNHQDADNDIAPSDHDRWYASTVLRVQTAITPTLAWLTESSIAKEHSRNGRNIREHEDSIFANTDGLPDSRGLEFGDRDTRITWQGKAGLVFNPLGPGIFSTQPPVVVRLATFQSKQCILKSLCNDSRPVQ